ncbi:MAG: SDR family oxidoreductase [Paludibacteraceae bacterium]|nr:SDR family oxidoreductase [Paludibacteraceae bacterium]
MESYLKDKRGIILGALDEHSLAWHVALRCQAAGATVVLSNTEMALRLGTISSLAKTNGMPLITADLTNIDDIRHLISEAQVLLGGKIDFILHSVAQSQNLRRHKSYADANYTYYMQTLDISAISLHKLLQTCYDQDALAPFGSVVALTYLASERFQEGYNDMADAKALLESIARNWGGIYGQHNGVRVNTISQSPVATHAEEQFEFVHHFHEYAEQMAPLGRATADDLADVCVALFSDLTRKITMQTIMHDGGFSKTLLSNKGIEHLFRLNAQKANE